MTELNTTFARLRKAGACSGRYKHLRGALKDVGDNDLIDLLTILETNGLDDALWAMCATIEDCEQVARLMAADFAEDALPIWLKYHPDDDRPCTAIQAARDFAHGRIAPDQLDVARDAAWAAAGDAAWAAAGAAAWAAAGDAAWAAAGDAARAAAGAAAGDAAGDAARAAAWAAAWDRQKQIFIRHLQPETGLDRAEALEQAIAVRKEVLTITEYFPSRKDAPDA